MYTFVLENETLHSSDLRTYSGAKVVLVGWEKRIGRRIHKLQPVGHLVHGARPPGITFQSGLH
jgi:hypothetical protein